MKWWVQVSVSAESCEDVDGNRSKGLEVKRCVSALESCEPGGRYWESADRESARKGKESRRISVVYCVSEPVPRTLPDGFIRTGKYTYLPLWSLVAVKGTAAALQHGS